MLSWVDHQLPQLLIQQFDTLPIQSRHIEHKLEGVWFKKNDINLDNFSLIWLSYYAQIVLSWADQLLPQLLIQQSDTLLIQCKHIKSMHEGVWFKNNSLTK